MTRPLFTLVGMGDNGLAGLAEPARDRIMSADVIIGSKRLLSYLPRIDAETHPWPSPFDPMVDQIRDWAGKSVVILATGDPMWFGAGSTLLKHFEPGEFQVVPHVSAFQLAAARMGWALQDTQTLSVHGRSLSLIEPHIQPGVHLLVLTSGATSIQETAGRFVERGFGQSRFTVLEHMDGERENHASFAASTVPARQFSGFHTLAIDCVADSGAQWYPRTPGLPDDAFVHDGQLTKREVRAATVSALAPFPGAILWDVGAGCGSVAIEWLRSAPGTQAIAFERDPARIAMIAQNRERLGTPHLQIVDGDAPDTFEGQPEPDATFIGGSVASEDVFAACWQALKTGGRLVANAVTLESEAHLIALQAKFGGELVRIGVEHLSHVGMRRVMRPRMTVTQWLVTKS